MKDRQDNKKIALPLFYIVIPLIVLLALSQLVYAKTTISIIDGLYSYSHIEYYQDKQTTLAACNGFIDMVDGVRSRHDSTRALCVCGGMTSSGFQCQAGWMYESGSGYPGISHLYTAQYPTCVSGFAPDRNTGACMQPKMPPGNPVCGNPINSASGNKYQEETDYSGIGLGGLEFTRFYNSQSIYSDSTSSYSNDNYLGVNWRHNHSQRLTVAGALGSRQITVSRPNGRKLVFREQDSVFHSDADIVSTLQPVTLDNGQDGWAYQTESHTTETYNAQGQLLLLRRINRTELAFQYDQDANQYTLDRISDNSGRILQLNYDANQHLEKVIMPDNSEIGYSYDSKGRLVTVTQIASGEERSYHYENSTLPYHLTGITDENGSRYATWAYDDQGRAISSEHAGGVDKTTIDYIYIEDTSDPRVTVTNPLGKQTTYHFTTIHGVRKVTQVEGHPTNSCEGANKAYSYDANGNVVSKTDWNEVTTTYSYDLARNLETSRTEASGTPQERSVTTEWHAEFRLPTKITEPGRVTEYAYDAQGRQLSSSVQGEQ